MLCICGGNILFQFVSPKTLELSPNLITDIINADMSYQFLPDLQAAISTTDVLYCTRLHIEQFVNEIPMTEIFQWAMKYVVNEELMMNAKPSVIVMHPLPRLFEIPTEFDSDPRAAYFRQQQNGQYVLMALLEKILK